MAKEALGALDEAAALADEGECVYGAEIHRVAGELLLATTEQHAEVEARLLRAVRIARAQQARSLELRAAISLARAWKVGRRERGEARHLLASVYGWFTEGFDTPDLQDAKVLLEALR
jgi:predicted ATPase